MDSRPVLDACLIVRDEEANLPRCLASLEGLRPLLGSINVYDTGSADRTIQIAREAGCNVQEGYWDDDFARARNASLEMSSAEWALTIDADEEIVADVADLLRRLRRDDADAFGVVHRHVDSAGAVWGRSTFLKILRRSEVRYARSVHEVAARRDGSACRLRSLPEATVVLRHHGYATPELREAKATRNAAAAARGLATARELGDNAAVAHAARHLGRSLAGLGRQREALKAYEEALTSYDTAMPAWRLTAVDMTTALLAENDLEGAVRLVARLQSMGSDALTLRDILARISAHRADHASVLALTAPWCPPAAAPPARADLTAAADRAIAEIRLVSSLALQDLTATRATLEVLVRVYGDQHRLDDLMALTPRADRARLLASLNPPAEHP